MKKPREGSSEMTITAPQGEAQNPAYSSKTKNAAAARPRGGMTKLE
jgi:hypothetical protein